jgi:hypothetical protein
LGKIRIPKKKETTAPRPRESKNKGLTDFRSRDNNRQIAKINATMIKKEPKKCLKVIGY